MHTGLLPSLLLALLTPVAAAAAIAIAPERPLTEPTYGRQTTGSIGTVAADPDGFLAIWRTDDLRLMTTRYDREGQRANVEGKPLGLRAFSVSAVWTGSDYALAMKAYEPAGAGVFVMRVAADGTVLEQPRLLVSEGYASNVGIAVSDSSLLVTWMTQSGLTQTVSGVIVDATLAVVIPPFVVAIRDAPFGLIEREADADVTGTDTGFMLVWENVTEPHKPIIKSIAVDGEVPAGTDATFATPVHVAAVTADESGAVMTFADDSSLFAVRLTDGGIPIGEPARLADADRALATDLASAGDDFLLLASVTAERSCGYATSPADIVAVSFGGDLRARGEPAHVVTGASIAGHVSVAGHAGRFIGGWSHEDCGTDRRTRADALILAGATHQVETLSNYFELSSQTDPVLVSNDRDSVAVWLEARGEDAAPQVYATVISGSSEQPSEGGRVSNGTRTPARPRAAWDGRRFLVAWHDRDTIRARFLTATGASDGDELAIGHAAATPALDVIWTGTTYLLSWATPDGVNAALIDPTGRTIDDLRIGEQRGVVAISSVAGPGEAMIAIGTTRDADGDGTLSTVVLREGGSVATNVLSAVVTGCVSKCDRGFTPIGVAWTGSHYRVAWIRQHHPAYGFSIETAELAHGGQQPGPTQLLFANYSSSSRGSLVWTGRFYAAALPIERGAPPLTAIMLSEGPFYLLSTFAAAAMPAHGPVMLLSSRTVDGAERLFVATLVDVPQPRRRAASR